MEENQTTSLNICSVLVPEDLLHIHRSSTFLQLLSLASVKCVGQRVETLLRSESVEVVDRVLKLWKGCEEERETTRVGKIAVL
ncbi:hypothetical protein CMV_014199 [Castanea mollissima]|uniref:Uncharacterized protein n=1 Tax=Castanea mollissima TaxID=60419 RepID=A0A8J4R748_9ROSI|nr:hypothetical protein CMV_014199 [Castanea mollissima]